MHVHRVMVKLKDPAAVDECRALMESMRDEIDYMIDLRVRINTLEGAYSCDLSLSTTWANTDDYERYTRDPAHLAVRGRVLDLTAEAMTLDYTSPEPQVGA